MILSKNIVRGCSRPFIVARIAGSRLNTNNGVPSILFRKVPTTAHSSIPSMRPDRRYDPSFVSIFLIRLLLNNSSKIARNGVLNEILLFFSIKGRHPFEGLYQIWEPASFTEYLKTCFYFPGSFFIRFPMLRLYRARNHCHLYSFRSQVFITWDYLLHPSIANFNIPTSTSEIHFLWVGDVNQWCSLQLHPVSVVISTCGLSCTR